MVVSSHHLAAQSGLRVLRAGGNAIEAMIAAAATISVVYPHMNGIGGDGFWLIATPGQDAPTAILGVGRAGHAVDTAFYRALGLDAIPTRGPLAANTVAGTVSSWAAAHEIAKRWGGTLPLAGKLISRRRTPTALTSTTWKALSPRPSMAADLIRSPPLVAL